LPSAGVNIDLIDQLMYGMSDPNQELTLLASLLHPVEQIFNRVRLCNDGFDRHW
jgi:hypothetical protein